MAEYMGIVRGSRGEASRLGGKASGLVTTAASWQGAVEVTLHQCQGDTYAVVTLRPWRGAGVSRTLYNGPVNGRPDRREAV